MCRVPARRAAWIGLAVASLVASRLEAFMPAPDRERGQRAVSDAAGLWWRIPLLAFLFFANHFRNDPVD